MKPSLIAAPVGAALALVVVGDAEPVDAGLVVAAVVVDGADAVDFLELDPHALSESATTAIASSETLRNNTSVSFTLRYG